MKAILLASIFSRRAKQALTCAWIPTFRTRIWVCHFREDPEWWFSSWLLVKPERREKRHTHMYYVYIYILMYIYIIYVTTMSVHPVHMATCSLTSRGTRSRRRSLPKLVFYHSVLPVTIVVRCLVLFNPCFPNPAVSPELFMV